MYSTYLISKKIVVIIYLILLALSYQTAFIVSEILVLHFLASNI